MRIIVPLKRKHKWSVNKYINECNRLLNIFKTILMHNISKSKLNMRKKLLFKLPCIKWIIKNDNYDILLIIRTYINRLMVFYSPGEDICYYSVPNNIRCPYTVDTLNKVIRIIEYGTLDMKPLYWIRRSLNTLKEYIEITYEDNTKKKNKSNTPNIKHNNKPDNKSNDKS